MGIKPDGVFGKDWDSESIIVQNGAHVRITATNQTRNAQSGNRSRIILYVNDRVVSDITNESARVSVSFDIKEDGKYDVTAVGTNELADAFAVNIAAERIGATIFG